MTSSSTGCRSSPGLSPARPACARSSCPRSPVEPAVVLRHRVAPRRGRAGGGRGRARHLADRAAPARLADRHRSFLNRLLSFARLSAPAAEGSAPDRFVATSGGVAVAGGAVALDGTSRRNSSPCSAAPQLRRRLRRRPFLAVLLGLPAVVVADRLDESPARRPGRRFLPADLRAAARGRRRRGGRSRRAATRPGRLARSRSRARQPGAERGPELF